MIRGRTIQIGALMAGLMWLTPAWAATCYTADGIVSNNLEVQRWMINRARFAPEQEADRLGLTNSFPNGHPDYDVCEDVDTNAFGGTTNDWAKWIISLPPLAPNAIISTATEKHSRDMAETQIFSHYSPSSRYYPLNSPPEDRGSAEGYDWVTYGENIGCGYLTNIGTSLPPLILPPNVLCDALFIDKGIPDRGHRQNILWAEFREIGLGYAQMVTNIGTTNILHDYYTQDYGADSTNHFFTDTIFSDANTNSVYDEGEGVGGIEIRLWDGTNQAAWYDVSGTSGSFAVPINSLIDGRPIRVELTNTNAASRQITFPLGYSTLAQVTLTNLESFIAGHYTQPAGITNVGFRDLIVTTQCAGITITGTNATVAFSSLGRVSYRLEASTNLLSTNWTAVASGTATGRTSQLTATATNSSSFFRVILLRN